MDLIAQHVSCGPLMMACVMPSLASYALLREDKYEEFLASVPETLAKLRDLNSKELGSTIANIL